MIMVQDTRTKQIYTCEDNQLEAACLQLEAACLQLAGGGYTQTQTADAMMAASEVNKKGKSHIKHYTIEKSVDGVIVEDGAAIPHLIDHHVQGAPRV